jgi:Domain of unknown function (DUF3291)
MSLLAQVDVARMRGPLDSAVMREFADGFDPVDKLADRAPGFVWRLQTGGHAPLVEDLTRLWVVNVSLWRDYPALARLRPPRPARGLPAPPVAVVRAGRASQGRAVVGRRRRAPGRARRPRPAARHAAGPRDRCPHCR